MQNDNCIIELVNVHKSYGLTEVLKGVNLTVKQGDFISVRGKSGVGKTNLFKIIGLLEKPNKGISNLIRKGRFNTKRRPENKPKTKTNRSSLPILQPPAFTHSSRKHRITNGAKPHQKTSKTRTRKRTTKILRHNKTSPKIPRQPQRRRKTTHRHNPRTSQLPSNASSR